MIPNFLKFSRIQEVWGSRTEPESMRVIVSIFWRTLLVLAFIVFILALWIGFQELGAVAQVENPNTASSAAPSPWTPQQIQSTLDVFSQRQNQYQSLAGSPLPNVADPSK